jgi:hypothetical protein
MAKQSRSFWTTPNGWGAIALIGAVSYFLIVEHREHVFSFLPFLILLLCPLMHVFMHRGHSHHHNSDDNKADASSDVDNDAYLRGLEEGKRQAQNQSSSEGEKNDRGK